MKSNRRIQYLAAFAVALTSMCYGATFFWITSTLPRFFNKEIIADISNAEISWVVSIMIVGLMIGSGVGSSVSDKFGRRTALTTSALPHIIGTVLILFAANTWMLYIGRILWGCGLGMTSTVSSIYLSEIADKEIRGTLTVITRIVFSIGVMIVLTIGSYVSYPVLTGIMTTFAASYFFACMWIPESPYYLLKEGKVDAAKKVLLRLGGRQDEKVLEDKLSLMRSDVRKEMARSGTIKELFTGKQYRRALIAATGVRGITLLTGIIPMQQYFGSILLQSNCGIQVSTALVIFGAVRFIVGLVSPLTVDRIGRRPLLISTYSAAGIFFAIVGLYFFMQQVIRVDDESMKHFSYVVFIGITAACTIANIGYNVIYFIIPSEIFPLNVKSIAMTVLFIFGSVLHFIVVKGYQVMEDFAGLYGVFWFYATMAFSGAVFTYFLVPETRGKSLREIQIELQGNIYDESDEKLNQIEAATDNGVDDKELMNMIKDNNTAQNK